MYHYTFYFPEYALRGYERELGCLEVQALIGQATVFDQGNTLELISETPLSEEDLKHLTFFEKVIIRHGDQERIVIPHQVIFDKMAKIVKLGQSRKEITHLVQHLDQIRNGRREHTYLTHALHRYKGKFYPQLAKSIMNYAKVRPGNVVLDLFAGSGTTLLECYLNNIIGIGIDLNPLAVFITKVKIESLRIPPTQLEEEINALVDRLSARAEEFNLCDELIGRALQETDVNIPMDYWQHLSEIIPNFDYLKDWFSKLTLCKIGVILSEVDSIPDPRIRDLCMLTLSNILREFSYQDPGDLRIRRRKDHPPDHRFLSRYTADLINNTRIIYVFNEIKQLCNVKDVPSYSYCGDARSLGIVPNKLLSRDEQIDLIITSPPYATALPYIDTDRLSLFLLGLLSSQSRAQLERNMIGNREIRKSERLMLERKFIEEEDTIPLPKQVKDFINTIHRLNSLHDAGFRRKNKAALLCKYFMDMHKVFLEAKRVLKPGKLCVIIIGNNHTYAGGQRINIPTDEFLIEIATCIGFELVHRIAMTDQPAYMAHSRNAIKSETILILRK